MTKINKIALIGVNYNSETCAIRFIEGVSKLLLDDIEFTIILIDNTERLSSDDFFSKIHAINNNVICIKALRNLGYFGGARLGLSTLLKDDEYPDWLIVTNVDIEFKDRYFLQILKTFKDHVDKPGVIAPTIWSNFSKRDINPKIVKRPSKRKMEFYTLIFSTYYSMNLYELLSAAKLTIRRMLKYILKKMTLNYHKDSTNLADKFQVIYAPHGSCIIFSKEYFLSGGSLNYPQFLFNEEIFVAETVRALGLNVVYIPKLKVIDDEHVSTGIIRSRKMFSYISDSACYITNTYFK